MKIVYVYADTPAHWDRSERRCAIPARALNRSSRHSATMISRAEFAASSVAGPAQQACLAADLIVVQGSMNRQTLKALQSWRARDKAIVADIDRAEHLQMSGRPGAGTDPASVRMGLKLVHAATLPSRRLAADYQDIAPVFHLPSYIDPENYLYTPRGRHDEVLIGWRGGNSHVSAFANSGVAEALRNVCLARPQVKVLLCTSDARLKEIVQLPPAQVIWQPWAPFAEWPNLLASFDIGIAPLDGEYDQRRCWSQALEYMIQRIPWVASAGPAFLDLAQFGWLVSNHAPAWERVLLDMVDHLDDYRLEADRDAYLFAIGQSIDENIDKVLNIYTHITGQAAVTYDAARDNAGVGLDRG